jgi:hypothetical protein
LLVAEVVVALVTLDLPVVEVGLAGCYKDQQEFFLAQLTM